MSAGDDVRGMSSAGGLVAGVALCEWLGAAL